MSVAAAAKRRRRQAVMGYTHMAPMRRPHYSIPTLEKSQRRERNKAEVRKRMMTKKGK